MRRHEKLLATGMRNCLRVHAKIYATPRQKQPQAHAELPAFVRKSTRNCTKKTANSGNSTRKCRQTALTESKFTCKLQVSYPATSKWSYPLSCACVLSLWTPVAKSWLSSRPEVRRPASGWGSLWESSSFVPWLILNIFQDVSGVALE